MPNNDSPSKGASRTARGFVIGLVVVAASAVLCCGGIITYGVLKAPQLARSAQTSFADFTRWSTLISARFGLPCSVQERSFTTTGAGTRTTLSLTFTNVPEDRIPGGSREAFALDAARYARSIARPGVAFTEVCVVFATRQNVGPLRMGNTEPHCFAWAALEVPEASGIDASVR